MDDRAQAVDVLAKRLQQATALRAAQLHPWPRNRRTPKILELLQPYLESENPILRAAAVDALRRVPGGKVDTVLARALFDEERRVREMAIAGLPYRSPTPVLVYALRDALMTEPEEALKKQLIRHAADWIDAAPILRASLERNAASDPSEEVRNAARHALTKGKQQ